MDLIVASISTPFDGLDGRSVTGRRGGQAAGRLKRTVLGAKDQQTAMPAAQFEIAAGVLLDCFSASSAPI
jgi:hypothetical protein